MKSVYNHLKGPVAHYINKDIFKEGINKASSVVSQKMKNLEIQDKVSINPNNQLYKQQASTYKSQAAFMKEFTNSLSYIPRANYTSIDKVIDVTSDYVFKGIFSDGARAKDFLESVLIGQGKILPEGTKIKDLQYLKTEYIQDKHPEDAKRTIFDLQIETNNGIFIIEMQKNISPDYLKRMEFYNAIAYSQQQIKGDGSSSMKDYAKALPIVTISVISKKLFDDKVPCVSYHVNVERKTQERHMKAFSYVFIELDKFDNSKYDQSNISNNEKDWLTFMKTQNLDHKYDNEQVNSAAKYVQDIRDHKYDAYLRAQMSEMAAEKEKESAVNERVEKVAKGFKDSGVDIDIISKNTGLSKERIEKL